ncbi:Protein LURP-one-related like [Actinidia chinensis var. chinensis]|uniref:Protein LURP-one-related like n=1 Tax=Actinidia chinensis var. chinensis TaxID=1590841 RepID=A0A2R6QJF1_ACTCC|nr:Protein LURP-one-related like [Actinidia chinensis var. chinensis]
MDISAPEFQANLQIPIDLFVSKSSGADGGDGLRFTDSSGNLVFRVERQSPESSHKRVLVDASGNHLIYIHNKQNGSWQGFTGNNSEEKDLLFRVERTLNAFNRTEFKVFPVGENGGEDSKSDFQMKGSPFYRSCTIYKGNSVLAQTSLMYKLGIQKVLVRRHKFRLTIFPGSVDHAFIVSLIVIYFHGRKLWI